MSELKNLFGLTLVPAAILCGIIATTASRRLRDMFFFLFVVFTVMTQRLDVNFVSREWYRGTTRGFEFSAMDVLSLSIFFSSLLRPQPGQSRFYWPPSLGLLLLFFCYAALSVGISDPQLFGLFELSKMLRGLVVFLVAALFIRTERELRILVLALACVVCWQGMFALYQRFYVGLYRIPASLGDPNSFSMYLCMLCPVFVAAVTSDFPKLIKYLASLAMLLGGIGVILSISRTGVATLVVVMLGATLACMSLKVTPKKIGISLLVVLVTGGLFFKAWNTLETRYREATLDQEYHGKGQGRGYYLRLARAIASDRFFGVGLNNWSYWVSNDYGPRLGYHFVPYIGTERWPSDVVPPGRNIDAAQAAPAHNLGALVLGELGVPGLVLFALLWMRWFQMGMSFLWKRVSDPMHRMGVGFFFACWGIFLQSLTEWVYRQTSIFFTFNVLLGALASLYWLKRQRKRELAEEEAEWEDDSDLGLVQLDNAAPGEG
ncbi:MAG: hypothetical protein JWR69_342 [Pedosphaera sp.]|nr:hypothetical protein [Pedosphaera sp.]